MDPITIAAAAAGYQVARKSIKAVNEALKTANEVKDIGHALEGLFHHLDGKPEKKKKQKTFSKLRQALSTETHTDVEDDTSLGAVAADVLEQKKMERQIYNLSVRIDNRFGEGSWKQILEERDRRLQEKAEREKKKKEEARLDAIYKEDEVSAVRKIGIEAAKAVGILGLIAVLVFLFMQFAR